MKNSYYFQNFKFCPVCGARYQGELRGNLFACSVCGYKFYQNSNPCVGIVIPKKDDEREVLIVQRNIAPFKGQYDLPGGIVEFAETFPEAAKREIKEELGFEPVIQDIIGTDITDYPFENMLYSNVGVYYLVKPINESVVRIDESENSSWKFVSIEAIITGEVQLAWECDHRAIVKYNQILNSQKYARS